jgi:hypothetical protein
MATITASAAASGVASAMPARPNRAPNSSWMAMVSAGGSETLRASISGDSR